MFDEILGQHHPRALLTQVLERDRVPQAILFEGPEGVGKATLARFFIAALLCTDDEPGACGVCDACRVKGADGHPDVTRIRRLSKKERVAKAWKSQTELPPGTELARDISVDQIRELTRSAGMSPRSAKRRVFLIDPADRMSASAQNALLKTLEEPSQRTVLILIASRPRLLLPTVRSRCFSVRFTTLRTAELAGLLQSRGCDADEAQLRAALAEGRPGHALDIDLDALRDRRAAIVELLEKLASSPSAAAALSPMAAELAGKDEATLLTSLQLLQGILRDASRAAIDPQDTTLVHADLADRLGALGAQLTPARAALLVASTDRLRDQLRFNLNRTLIAEALLAGVAGGPIP